MISDRPTDSAPLPTPEPLEGPAVSRVAWWRWLERLLGAVLFGTAFWVLVRELRSVDTADIARAAAALPTWQIGLAVAATVLNYTVLTGYDHLAIRQLQRTLSAWHVSIAAFVAFAVVNNVGFALISGPWARYRFYVRWGVELSTLPQVVAFNAITLWTGLFALLGAVLAVEPDPALAAWAPLIVWRLAGAAMLGSVVAYVLLAAMLRRPLRIWRWTVRLPAWPLALGQVLVSVADWCLIAAVLWLLLPEGTLAFGPLLVAFLVAQLLGLASHVPGGLGVFEGTMLALLHGKAPAHNLLAGLLLFRIVYYLLPLVLALLILVADTATSGARTVARR